MRAVVVLEESKRNLGGVMDVKLLIMSGSFLLLALYGLSYLRDSWREKSPVMFSVALFLIIAASTVGMFAFTPELAEFWVSSIWPGNVLVP